jgi:hypothetical protein
MKTANIYTLPEVQGLVTAYVNQHFKTVEVPLIASKIKTITDPELNFNVSLKKQKEGLELSFEPVVSIDKNLLEDIFRGEMTKNSKNFEYFIFSKEDAEVSVFYK